MSEAMTAARAGEMGYEDAPAAGAGEQGGERGGERGAELLAAPPGSRRMRRAQLAAVTRIELARQLVRRRAFGAMVLAAVPVLMMTAWALLDEDISASPSDAHTVFAHIFRGFLVNLVIFFGTVVIFSTLIRREVRDKTLHYHFLAPVRRDLLMAGKYAAGVLAGWLIFGLSTALSFGLAYVPFLSRHPVETRAFFLDGPGFAHLGAYLLVTALAVVGYGAVFLALGMFFKNPVFPAVGVYFWEIGNFLLPPVLKKVSIVHYLTALLPVPVTEGPFALLSELPSPWLAAPGLLVVSAALVALAAWKIRRMEVLYGED